MATEATSIHGHIYYSASGNEKLFAPAGIDASAVVNAYAGWGVRHLLVRNCVAGGETVPCDIEDCPLMDRDECVLLRRNVKMIQFRPAQGPDEDEMRRRFPVAGNRVPAIRGYVNGCPHSAAGATFHIAGVGLVRGGARSGNEVAVSGDLVSLFTDYGRPENILTEEFLGAYTSPPKEVAIELKKWETLITTERKVLAGLKKGVRYVARRFDGKRHTVVVTATIPWTEGIRPFRTC